MRPYHNLKNKIPTDTHRRFQLVFYKSSGSQFFRATTGTQSGPDTFDKSRFAMTFFTNSRVKEILCSFRLVLERKTGKEILESSRLEFSEKI